LDRGVLDRIADATLPHNAISSDKYISYRIRYQRENA